MQEKAPTSIRSVRLEPTKLVLGTRTPHQATGDADSADYCCSYHLLLNAPCGVAGIVDNRRARKRR